MDPQELRPEVAVFFLGPGTAWYAASTRWPIGRWLRNRYYGGWTRHHRVFFPGDSGGVSHFSERCLPPEFESMTDWRTLRKVSLWIL